MSTRHQATDNMTDLLSRIQTIQSSTGLVLYRIVLENCADADLWRLSLVSTAFAPARLSEIQQERACKRRRRFETDAIESVQACGRWMDYGSISPSTLWAGLLQSASPAVQQDLAGPLFQIIVIALEDDSLSDDRTDTLLASLVRGFHFDYPLDYWPVAFMPQVVPVMDRLIRRAAGRRAEDVDVTVVTWFRMFCEVDTFATAWFSLPSALSTLWAIAETAMSAVEAEADCIDDFDVDMDILTTVPLLVCEAATTGDQRHLMTQVDVVEMAAQMFHRLLQLADTDCIAPLANWSGLLAIHERSGKYLRACVPIDSHPALVLPSDVAHLEEQSTQVNFSSNVNDIWPLSNVLHILRNDQADAPGAGAMDALRSWRAGN